MDEPWQTIIGATIRFARATATNQVARLAPRFYVRATGQTGRGDSRDESPGDIAGYFLTCFEEYLEACGVALTQRSTWLSGKTVLEYGPGGIPGVALLMVANGAAKAYCVDRFPMLSFSPKNIETIERLALSLGQAERERMLACFKVKGDATSGLDPARIEYLVRPSGLFGLLRSADVALSRAVLEHVDDLGGTVADIERALRPGGVSAHLVDLRSHGLHRASPLDFLCWPEWMWQLMYSQKGVPNRLRLDEYRRAISNTGLVTVRPVSTRTVEQEDIECVRSKLARRFRGLPDEDLLWLGFWIVLQKPASTEVAGPGNACAAS